MSRLISACALLCATQAFAQFEMDLSEPKTDIQYRPSIAILGVAAKDTDEISKSRARLLEAELVQVATQSEQFNTVIEPPLAAKHFTVPLAKCADWACLEKAAKAVKADRVVFGILARNDRGSHTLTIFGLDPAMSEVLTRTQEGEEKAEHAFAGVAGKSQKEKDRDFSRSMRGFVSDSLTKLSTANGKLVIDNVERASQVYIDEVLVGSGRVELPAQRGTRRVRVTADGYNPFETEASVDAARVTTVQVVLVAKAVEKVVTQAPVETGSGTFKRPGLYVGIAGLLVAGLGVGFGLSAKGIEAQAVDANHDGIIDISRAQARQGLTQALLANVLVATGLGLVAGGAIWFFVTPAPELRQSLEPTEGGAFGVYGALGGHF